MSRCDFDEPSARPAHRYAWLWEPLETDASFLLKAMFGGKAVYLNGRMQMVFFAKTEPWRGVLVCTDRSFQESLRAEFPCLVPHPVLPKWLYLSETLDDFERVAQRLVTLVSHRDPRIGVDTPAKKRARVATRFAKSKPLRQDAFDS